MSSFHLWAVDHIWIAKALAVLLIVASGFVHGRLGHMDKSVFALILGCVGWGFLGSAYLLNFKFSMVPFFVAMTIVPSIFWYSGFDEGRFRKTDVAFTKLVVGLAIMIGIFKLVEIGKLG